MCFRMTQTVHFVVFLLLTKCSCLLPKWLIGVFFHAFYHSSFVFLCLAWLIYFQFVRLFELDRRFFSCSLCTYRWQMRWQLQSGWRRGSWRSTVTNLNVFICNDYGCVSCFYVRSPLRMLLHSHRLNLVLVVTGFEIKDSHSLIFPFAIRTTDPSAFWVVAEEPLFQFP